MYPQFRWGDSEGRCLSDDAVFQAQIVPSPEMLVYRALTYYAPIPGSRAFPLIKSRCLASGEPIAPFFLLSAGFPMPSRKSLSFFFFFFGEPPLCPSLYDSGTNDLCVPPPFTLFNLPTWRSGTSSFPGCSFLFRRTLTQLQTSLLAPRYLVAPCFFSKGNPARPVPAPRAPPPPLLRRCGSVGRCFPQPVYQFADCNKLQHYLDDYVANLPPKSN